MSWGKGGRGYRIGSMCRGKRGRGYMIGNEGGIKRERLHDRNTVPGTVSGRKRGRG